MLSWAALSAVLLLFLVVCAMSATLLSGAMVVVAGHVARRRDG